jgi:hypothetical protein
MRTGRESSHEPGGETRTIFTIMSKSTRNSGQPWTPAAQAQLKTLAAQNTPTRVIGLKMGRSPGAIATQASQQGVSLKPTNQSPYNRKK